MSPDERAMLQGLVDDFYEKFLAVVQEARPELSDSRLRELADGRVMSGTAAAEAGLVDETGDLYTAVAAAQRLAGVKRADVVVYHRPLEYVASPYAAAGAGKGDGGTQVNMLQLNLGEGGSGVGLPTGFLLPLAAVTHVEPSGRERVLSC